MLQLRCDHVRKLWLPPAREIIKPTRPHPKRSKLAMPSWAIYGNERFRGAVTQAGIIPPDQIFGANLIAWWDAADGLSGSGSTAKATDKTANGNNLINTDAACVIRNTALNGFPAYGLGNNGGVGISGLFSGSGPSTNSFPGLGGAGAVFGTINILSTSSSGAKHFSLLPTSQTNDTDNLFSITAAINVSTQNLFAECHSNVSTAFTFSFATNYRVATVWNSTTFWFYINGTPQDVSGVSAGGTINIGNGSAEGFSLGIRDDDTGGSIDGYIGNTFVTNITPNSTQLGQVEAYQKNHYNLS